MAKAWFYQIFKFEGRAVDIYISRKARRTTKQPFAFVRFASKVEALRAVKTSNGTMIRGNIIGGKHVEYK